MTKYFIAATIICLGILFMGAAIVEPGVKIGLWPTIKDDVVITKKCSIGDYVYIGYNSVIGQPNSKLIKRLDSTYPFFDDTSETYISDNVTIGANCVIESGTTIEVNCIIGNNVIIKTGVIVPANSVIPSGKILE